MTEITTYRCDRCGFLEADPAQIMRLAVGHSENFYVKEQRIELCARCEESLERWLKMATVPEEVK